MQRHHTRETDANNEVQLSQFTGPLFRRLSEFNHFVEQTGYTFHLLRQPRAQATWVRIEADKMILFILRPGHEYADVKRLLGRVRFHLLWRFVTRRFVPLRRDDLFN